MKQLLSLALLLGALPVHADTAQKGDYWVVHHQASLGKSKVYLADGDPSNIYERPGGAKSLGVYLFDQQPGKPDFTVYDVEVDCRNKRARVTGGARLQQRGQYLAQGQVLQSMAGRSTTVVGAKS
ncbi:hypothetical protein [Pseudomonas sp. KCJK9111]|uniref:hypothetical protein n=1 Tax=Pseudomonas sp. KCJK9111 TaxID=3344555 RepID=UPI003906AB5D